MKAPRRGAATLRHRILWRFWGGVALLVLVLAGEWTLSQSVHARYDRIAQLVEVSGRQRMLAQRVAGLVHRLRGAEGAERRRAELAALEEAADELTASVAFVAERWAAGSLPAVSARFLERARELGRLAAGGRALPDGALTAMDREADSLLRAFHDLVTQIVADAERRHQQQSRLEVALGLAMLAVLLGIAAFVLWPLLQRLGREKAMLEAQVARRTRALRESEAGKRLILDSVDDCMLLLDARGICRSINKAGAELLGRAPGEIVGQYLCDLMSEEEAAEHQERLRQVVRGRATLAFEYSRAGRQLQVRMHPVADNAGAVTGITVVGRDVTERRVAEMRLRESEARYRSIVETAREGIWMLDANGITTFVNQRLAAMLGVPRNRMFGKPFSSFVATGNAAAVWRKLAAKEESGVLEVQLRRADGSALWTALVGGPGGGAEGRAGGVVVMVTDISPRKEAEAASRREKERADGFLRLAGTIILALDSEGRVTLVNGKGCAALGRPEEEIIGRDFVGGFVAAEERPRVAEAIRALIAGEVPKGELAFECEVEGPDGGRRRIAWRSVITRDGDGRINGSISSGEEVG